MAETNQPVGDEEQLYRAILYPHWWHEAENRPSSAAFDNPVFSVDRAILSTPEETAARFREVLRLVEFNCGQARQIGFETLAEVDSQHPENLAHAHVYFLDYDVLAKNGRKKKARRLVEICQQVTL